MSGPYLPPDLLDIIADLLHDADDTLKSFCLVSKSWIPHARRHIFAEVVFRTAKDLKSWKSLFQNPLTSPAYYTRTLTINFCPVAMAGPKEGRWILTFSRVVRFQIGTRYEPATFLFPFRGFSPVLKSLHLVFTALTSLHVFNFICSFPLLESVSVGMTGNVFDTSGGFERKSAIVRSSSSLLFTGTLKLSLEMGMGPIASRLLSLPKGPHFRELRMSWYFPEDALSTAALVEKCSPTLEYLRICSKTSDDLSQYPLNLLNATKLERVTFLCPYNPRWATATLVTITPNHGNLQQISLCYGQRHLHSDPASFRVSIGDDTFQEWLDLDRFLAQLCESHSIRLSIMHLGPTSIAFNPVARSCLKSLFPEVTASGRIDLVDCSDMK